MAQWDPGQYLKFAGARLRPALDLLAQIDLEDPRWIVDLGCGTGHISRLLHQRWPRAHVTGVDSSPSMLQQAQHSMPQINWLRQDVRSWRASQPVDLIFSNAALHWLDGHEELLPTLVSQLAPGGVLAVQMPRNFDAPSHRLIAQTVRHGPWRAQLEALLQPGPVATPDEYYRLLESQLQPLQIWQSEYLHALSGPDPVKEWVKGSWLKPFLDALPAPQRPQFESDYAARLRQAYPALHSGVTLYGFRRALSPERRPWTAGE